MLAAGRRLSRPCAGGVGGRSRHQPACRIRREVKCTVFSEAELEYARIVVRRVPRAIDIHRPRGLHGLRGARLLQALDHPSRWRLRKAIEQGLSSAIGLGTPRLEAFGRCVVLRTAQWALDGRSKQATVEEFRHFSARSRRTRWSKGARELRAAVTANGRQPADQSSIAARRARRR